MSSKLVTIVVPSFNQGIYLDKCLDSIFAQNIPVEVFVMDGGSTDNTLEVIKKWENRLAGWKSRKDEGQSAAINEGMKLGTAPYCCWLNSDDYFLEDSLSLLLDSMYNNPDVPVVYGKVYNYIEKTKEFNEIWVEQFNQRRLAIRCIISQPGTLIRKSVWENVGGLNINLHMSMDYELWWKIYKTYGDFNFVDAYVAVNRDHLETKTNSKRSLHYKESMKIVKSFYGSVPIKWYIFQPYSVWFKALMNYVEKKNNNS
jgi:glycosyltransferase involved in cell wall biosynthesis